MSQPRLPHAPTRGFGARFWSRLLSKIEIENSLEMTLSRAKSGACGNPIFGSVEPCDLLETRSSLHYASKSKLYEMQKYVAGPIQNPWSNFGPF